LHGFNLRKSVVSAKSAFLFLLLVVPNSGMDTILKTGDSLRLSAFEL